MVGSRTLYLKIQRTMLKTILITGTSSGFGKLTALSLAKKGHRVIAAMRNVATKNAAIAKELTAVPNIEVIEMDVTSSDSVNAAIQTTLAKYNKIDVLINNAGVTGFGLFEAMTVEQMKKIFEVNLWGSVRNIHAVLPSMREHRSGLIINITSGLALITAPYIGAYNGSKWAIEGITETLRYELQNFGIETVTLQPGPFPTGIAEKPEHGTDRPAVAEAYGKEASEKIQKFGGIMFQKMEEYKMDAQEVADALVKLIETRDGARPFYTTVNRVTDNYEQEYIDKKTPYNQEWMRRMGWGEWL
jgi:NAD(P)-dependent dehydrogenase (short-subunit alcohol dehydrogenase family)